MLKGSNLQADSTHQIIGAKLGCNYWIQLFFRVEIRLGDLRIYSGLNICECTLSRCEVVFQERATAWVFPRAFNRNICVCSLVQCSSRTMKRLLGAVGQGLAWSQFSALTNLDQRYLEACGSKSKLSIKSSVLVINPKIPPPAQEVPRPPAVAHPAFILRKYHYLLFLYILPFFAQASTFGHISEIKYFTRWILA